MSKLARICAAGLLGLAMLPMASTAAWGAAAATSYSGNVLEVDQTAARIVVGDMGPLLDNGKSEITPRSVRVTPSTDFATAKRASGAAPSGWIGDYVETTLAAWEVKPGDFVTVTVRPDQRGSEALKITVVDTSEP